MTKDKPPTLNTCMAVTGSADCPNFQKKSEMTFISVSNAFVKKCSKFTISPRKMSISNFFPMRQISTLKNFVSSFIHYFWKRNSFNNSRFLICRSQWDFEILCKKSGKNSNINLSLPVIKKLLSNLVELFFVDVPVMKC